MKTPQYKSTVGGILLPETSDTDLRRGLAVAKSKIHGLGLYADKIFKIHDIIWKETLTGRIATPEDDGPLRWANHSDGPNSILIVDQLKLIVGLIAISSIAIDEEITYDYSGFGHSGVSAQCNCKDIGCPGYFTLREEWGEKK